MNFSLRALSRRLLALSVYTATAFCSPLAAPRKMLAPTPPMGWNSWDSFGPTVREDEVKANADAVAAKLGWHYIVVDMEWYQPKARSHGYLARGEVTMDQYGRFVPSSNRFPSAANDAGLKSLADYVHSKGLKLAFISCVGSPAKPWRRAFPSKARSSTLRMLPTRSTSASGGTWKIPMMSTCPSPVRKPTMTPSRTLFLLGSGLCQGR